MALRWRETPAKPRVWRDFMTVCCEAGEVEVLLGRRQVDWVPASNSSKPQVEQLPIVFWCTQVIHRPSPSPF